MADRDRALTPRSSSVFGSGHRPKESTLGSLSSEEQRRMASLFSSNDRFANSIGEGAPLRSTEFSNDEFRVAAQSCFGVPLTFLKPCINQSPKFSASAPQM